MDLQGTMRCDESMVRALGWHELLGHAHRSLDVARHYADLDSRQFTKAPRCALQSMASAESAERFLELRGVLRFTTEAVASSDIIRDSHSSILDVPFTEVSGAAF